MVRVCAFEAWCAQRTSHAKVVFHNSHVVSGTSWTAVPDQVNGHFADSNARGAAEGRGWGRICSWTVANHLLRSVVADSKVPCCAGSHCKIDF